VNTAPVSAADPKTKRQYCFGSSPGKRRTSPSFGACAKRLFILQIEMHQNVPTAVDTVAPTIPPALVTGPAMLNDWTKISDV